LITVLKSTLLVLVSVLLIYIGFKAYENSNNFILVTKSLSQKNSAQKKVRKKLDKLFEELSLGIYDKHSKNKKNYDLLERQAKKFHKYANIYLYLFFSVYLLFVILFYFLDSEFLLMLTALTALISLFVALFSPLLIMSVYKNLPILGNVTLSFESKSIIFVIEKLFSDSNYIVGILVLSFSMIIPILKSLILLLYGFFKETNLAENLLTYIEKIGKWSMADVFIVAILVVFFSTKQDIYTVIQLQTGLYFFIGYVLLSMMGTTLLARSQHYFKEAAN